jgi:NAD+ synthase (glutamine-hydrolysing)
MGKTGWHQTKTIVSQIPANNPKPPLKPRHVTALDPVAEVYQALVLGTRDYIHKNGFEKVVIGLSGGVDSAIVATIAVDALGKDNVIGISMPSRYSSTGSVTDTQKLTQNLGIKLRSISIEKPFQAYLETLTESFAGAKPDSAEENLQARVRGNLLMALSNKFGWLVLTTGDMAGGFAVIKDVPKTLVYKITKYRNAQAGFDLIPAAIIDKPPSAELRPDQKDSDSLPEYEILDSILTAYVEDDKSVDQIVALGFDKAIVQKTAKLVDRSEYKRRQAPPGVKITSRAFGRDRRLPLTSLFKEW